MSGFKSRRGFKRPTSQVNAVVVVAQEALDKIITNPLIERQCWWVNAMVPAAAAQLGLKARLVVGGMLYVAGRGAMDIVTFGDQFARPDCRDCSTFGRKSSTVGSRGLST